MQSQFFLQATARFQRAQKHALNVPLSKRSIQFVHFLALLIIQSASLGSGAALDMNGNDADFTAVPLSIVNAWVTSVFNAGNWSGPGILSAYAHFSSAHQTGLGVIQNNQSGSPIFNSINLFDGTVPGASDVLVKYTYFGDANLDGKVDGSDYSRIDNGYLIHLTGWLNGDFNYDGVINGSDYTLIDNAFNTQGASLAATIGQPMVTPKTATAVAKPSTHISPFAQNKIRPTDLPLPGLATLQLPDQWTTSTNFASGPIDWVDPWMKRFQDRLDRLGGTA